MLSRFEQHVIVLPILTHEGRGLSSKHHKDEFVSVSDRLSQASAAPADEGYGHPVALPPPFHAGPDGVDDAGEFVSGDVGEGDVVVSDPGVPVAAAQARGPDLDDHAAGRWHGRRHVADREGSGDLLHDQCAHIVTLPPPGVDPSIRNGRASLWWAA